MSHLLWQKSDTRTDERVMRFLAGDDVLLDREFFLHDIVASRAHVEGLARIHVLSADDAAALDRELDALARDFSSGDFILDARYEDGHSAIEARLTERLGDTGRKVHTGRSRNDQVLVATRLWLKERLATLAALCREAARVCLQRAEGESLPLPGYTHLQRAVVSSTTLWFAGFAESFIDDAQRARGTLEWLDANPLGTAAGYGVNLALDREHSTRALGFARMQVNPVAAQLSRGKFELAALEALGSALLDLRRLAWDLSLFTTAEFGFVTLPDEFTTGSSIMPNKRNPDVVELMRAGYASVAAARCEIEQLLSLPSGYQRDLQISKGALVHGFARGLTALELLPDLLAGMQWNPDRMRAAIEPSMYTTDVAIEQAAAGVPFREAYQRAAETAGAAGQGRTPEASLAARVSPGAAGDLRLDALRARLHALEGWREARMGVISTENAEHYRWGEACDGWHLLAGDDLSVIEERMPPDAAEQRHRHSKSRQFFYVLEGEALLELEGTPHVLRGGQGLHVPPGAAHQMRNDSTRELRFLVISAPKSHGDRTGAPLQNDWPLQND